MKNNSHLKKTCGNYVLIISLILTVLFAIYSIFFNKDFEIVSNALSDFLTLHFSWLYLITMMIFVFFSLYLAFGKYGNIKLGSDDSVPDYKTSSWFAMLLAAGVGIGFVFWSVSEPISHYMMPPSMGATIEGQSLEASDFAIRTTFMHWGIHPWASYCVIGIILGYFQFRKNKPALFSSVYTIWLGDNFTRSKMGTSIDILTVLATVAGLITSLALGVRQINSGLNYLFYVPESLFIQIIITIILTILFLLVAIAGLEKGVKLISNFNLLLALCLMVFAIIIGPSIAMLNNLVNGLGQYFGNFFKETLIKSTFQNQNSKCVSVIKIDLKKAILRVEKQAKTPFFASRRVFWRQRAFLINSGRINQCFLKDSFSISAFGDNSWTYNWRLFYWAWWITWAPFVASFIARISKGRTIRQFVFAVLVAPPLGSAIWFSVFGTLGINLGANDIVSKEVLEQIVAAPESGLFVVLGAYPYASLLVAAALLLVCTFLIISANSGTFVLAMITSKGNLNPFISLKVVWGIILAAMTIGVLVSKLKPLPIVMIMAFPFIFIMLSACISVIKALKQEVH